MKNGIYKHALFIATDQGKRPAYYLFPDGFIQKLNPPYTEKHVAGEKAVTAEELNKVLAGQVGKTALLDRCDALYARAAKRKPCPSLTRVEYTTLDERLEQAHRKLRKA